MLVLTVICKLYYLRPVEDCQCRASGGKRPKIANCGVVVEYMDRLQQPTKSRPPKYSVGPTPNPSNCHFSLYK